MKATEGTLDPAQVLQLHQEGKTVIQIARLLRRRNGAVVQALRDLGIRKTLDREWLLLHYVESGESIDSIASFWGIGEAAVRYHLRRHSVPIRYKSRGSIRNHLLADANWLRAMYVTEGRSLQEVADLAGCRVSSVRNALTRHGISRKVHPTGRYPSRRRGFVGRIRRLILERDGHRCRWPDCGSTDNLEINHVLPLEDGGDTTVENGITLCRSHHRSIRGREHDFIEMFRELLSSGPLT